MKRNESFIIAGKEFVVSGVFPRIAKLAAEYHDYLDLADDSLPQAINANAAADVFTFLQPVSDPVPKYPYFREADSIAVLPIETYENWWRKQINDKTRNMVRKAGKKGVTIRLVEFDDALVKGIQAIHNESPLRQGKPFRHYGKDFNTVKKAHGTYLDRSIFIGAFCGEALIGFIKLIILEESASIMQIISMVAHRDKAPTNALLAKAVELCADRKIRFLQYGVWSRRTMGAFKLHNGFTRFEIPRYFVPLTLRGRVALGLKLHHSLDSYIPETLVDILANLRARWYAFRLKAGPTKDRHAKASPPLTVTSAEYRD